MCQWIFLFNASEVKHKSINSMLKFMVKIFDYTIIHILQESQFSFIFGCHQLKTSENRLTKKTQNKTKKHSKIAD